MTTDDRNDQPTREEAKPRTEEAPHGLLEKLKETEEKVGCAANVALDNFGKTG